MQQRLHQRLDYNQRRPQSSLGRLTPSEFVQRPQGARTAESANPSKLSANGTNVIEPEESIISCVRGAGACEKTASRHIG
jgi:hypothetical protein